MIRSGAAILASGIAAAFLTVAAPKDAQADCFYHYAEDGILASGSFKDKALLGNVIPIVGGHDEEMAQDIGNLMNFECLYDNPGLRPDLAYAPDNLEQLPPLGALVRKLPIRLVSRKQDEYMSADVVCGRHISLNFDPATFLSGDGSEDERTKTFQEAIITLLSDIHRKALNGQPYQGHYRIYDSRSFVLFTPDNEDEACHRFEAVS